MVVTIVAPESGIYLIPTCTFVLYITDYSTLKLTHFSSRAEVGCCGPYLYNPLQQDYPNHSSSLPLLA